MPEKTTPQKKSSLRKWVIGFIVTAAYFLIKGLLGFDSGIFNIHWYDIVAVIVLEAVALTIMKVPPS